MNNELPKTRGEILRFLERVEEGDELAGDSEATVDEVVDYLAGRLPERDREEVEARIAVDPDLGARMQSLKETCEKATAALEERIHKIGDIPAGPPQPTNVIPFPPSACIIETKVAPARAALAELEWFEAEILDPHDRWRVLISGTELEDGGMHLTVGSENADLLRDKILKIRFKASKKPEEGVMPPACVRYRPDFDDWVVSLPLALEHGQIFAQAILPKVIRSGITFRERDGITEARAWLENPPGDGLEIR